MLIRSPRLPHRPLLSVPPSAEEWAEPSSAGGPACSLPYRLVFMPLVKKSVRTCTPLFYCVLIGCGPGTLFPPVGFLRVTSWCLPGLPSPARGRLKADSGLTPRGGGAGHYPTLDGAAAHRGIQRAAALNPGHAAG